MAKIVKATDDVIDFFNHVRKKTSIPQWIQFEVLSNNKQKELYKIIKTNDVVELLTDGINFAVIFNEEIFMQLPDDLKEMAIDECLAGVSVNDNDIVSLEKPNFNTHVSVLYKYGHDPIIMLHESIKSLFDAKKERDAEHIKPKRKKNM